jgi:Domain of unknown function (DUF4124)
MKLDWKRLFSLSILVLCWVAYPIAGTAGLYKWTDAQGNLHITDVPPASEEKSAPAAEPAPSVSPPAPQKKTVVKPPLPVERKRAEIAPVPSPTAASHAPNNKVRVQSPPAGLSPEQATVTSPWEVFEGNSANAKAGVQRWKDGKGIDHFDDVLLDARRHPGSP